ncbi:hypothetical protein [Vibrio campbellii]|uniref:hypothetical protein n=1 Tax=Vibrio campbellii TaxID=680 RepID=UPI0005EE23A6|nr:hypothetical protein [Vibrio campbellii]
MLLKDDKRELFDETPVKRFQLCKLYHVYERRNEWADWNGNTQLVSRSGKRLKTTLEEAENYAETMRKQGTKFFIDETPALLCQNENGCVVVTELFTKCPLKVTEEVLTNLKSLVKTPNDLLTNLPNMRWLAFNHYDKHERFQTYDVTTFYKRSSSPGHFLCWSLKVSEIETLYINNIIQSLNICIKA